MYLPKLISGEWTGAMNLTEPQAGSDVGALTTKAVPNGDGSYAITGQKIFITWGDHDMTDNIIQLVLARLPGCAGGIEGHLAVRRAEILRERGWLAGRAQHVQVHRPRAQDGHPRLAHLRDGICRRKGLADRRRPTRASPPCSR
jgi:alkylation response protein AidB-like acyl-CoA dehydrogenase